MYNVASSSSSVSSVEVTSDSLIANLSAADLEIKPFSSIFSVAADVMGKLFVCICNEGRSCDKHLDFSSLECKFSF